MTELKIKHIIIFENGMRMVFDQYGKQMPEYQDPEVSEEEVLKHADKDTKIERNINWQNIRDKF